MKHLEKNTSSSHFSILFQVLLISIILVEHHTCAAMKCRLVIGGLAGIDIYEEGWSSAGVIPAIELALERVNNHSDILKDYHLDIEWKDSRVCNSNEVP